MNSRSTHDKIFWSILLILGIVFLGFEYDRRGDFHIYLQAAGDLLLGKNMYHTLYGVPNVFYYLGSPTLAFLLSPLTFFPVLIGPLLWKLLNLFFVYRIWKVLRTYFRRKNITERQYTWFVLLAFAAIAHLIYLNFHIVQFTIFLLFTILESIHQIREKNRPVLGAAILGMGIISKLLPIIVIPYLVYRGHWKSVIWVVAVLAVLVMLPASYLGWEQNKVLYASWMDRVVSLSSQEDALEVSTRTCHGIGALISTLTVEGIGNYLSLPIKRNILSLKPETAFYLILFVKVGFVLFSLFFLKIKTIFRDPGSKLDRIWELSYILMVTPLIFPQQRSYAFVLIFPAMAYLIYGFMRNPEIRKPIPLVLFGMGFLLINLDLLLGAFREYYWHFKTMTYGVLIILGLLVWMSPNKVTGDR